MFIYSILKCCVIQGCILNSKFIFLPPPLFFIIFFPQLKFIIMRGCAPQVINFQPFLSNIVYFKTIGGKNMHFPPFFYPLSIFSKLILLWKLSFSPFLRQAQFPQQNQFSQQAQFPQPPVTIKRLN